MTTPRPFLKHGVGQLEELFARGKADAKVLKQLEYELQYRQVPRAVALLAEVQAAMSGGAAVPQSPPVPAQFSAQPPGHDSQQFGLWDDLATAPVVAASAVVRTDVRLVRLPETSPKAEAVAPPPAMPLEDAYKVLQVTPGATWVSIEQARRSLVQKSHPSRCTTLGAEQLAQALAQAGRVNAAYAALSRARCGGR